MDFVFTPEQDDLRQLVRTFFAKETFSLRAPGVFDAPLWTRLSVELGLTDLARDASLVEVAIVLEEAGRVLLPLPYLSTVVASFLSPGSSDVVALALEPSTVVARAVGDGYALDGTAAAVPDGDVAARALVRASYDGSPALFAVSLSDVDRVGMSTLDQTRPVARLTFAGTPAELLGPADRAGDLLALALAVESVGAASANLAVTVDYLRTRHQFGVPLATFQALRHRIADLSVLIETATSTTWYAIRAPEAEWPVLAPMAKLLAADAAYTVAAEAIQLHGGIGFTWEHPAHRYFKRATVTRLTNGDPVALRRRIATHAALFSP